MRLELVLENLSIPDSVLRELLYHAKFMPRNGCGVMVLSPTRELAMQIHSVAQQPMQKHSQTHGLLMGGANRRAEGEKLIKGKPSRCHARQITRSHAEYSWFSIQFVESICHG